MKQTAVFDESFGAVIFKVKAGRMIFLLVQHNEGLHWSFPKGHANAGESEEGTAKREIFEEVGLSVAFLPGFREVIKYKPQPGVRKRVIYFLAESLGGRVKTCKIEIKAHKWLRLKDSLKQLTHENDKECLNKANYFANAIAFRLSFN